MLKTGWRQAVERGPKERVGQRFCRRRRRCVFCKESRHSQRGMMFSPSLAVHQPALSASYKAFLIHMITTAHKEAELLGHNT